MTPEEAVRTLAVMLRTWEDFTQEDVHQRLLHTGLSARDAELTYGMTQVAWGRAFLNGLGITFAPTYVFVGAGGREIESGRLTAQPHYQTAMAIATSEQPFPGFLRLAMMSADVRVVNEMFNRGSNASDLMTGPPHLVLIDDVDDTREKSRKPWWRPW